MLLAAVERRGVGRSSIRLAVPGVVLGLAIGLVGPFDRWTRSIVPTRPLG